MMDKSFAIKLLDVTSLHSKCGDRESNDVLEHFHLGGVSSTFVFKHLALPHAHVQAPSKRLTSTTHLIQL